MYLDAFNTSVLGTDWEQFVSAHQNWVYQFVLSVLSDWEIN